MPTVKQFLFILSAPTVFVVGSLSALSAPAEIAASIQATAHVEASLGLSEATVVPGERSLEIVAGSHLYWLYCPRYDGVLIQVSGLSQTRRQSDSSVPENIVSLVPEILREYAQVSLVDLSEAADLRDADAPTVMVTLIFADN